jgi:hypothetical protein
LIETTRASQVYDGVFHPAEEARTPLSGILATPSAHTSSPLPRQPHPSSAHIQSP